VQQAALFLQPRHVAPAANTAHVTTVMPASPPATNVTVTANPTATASPTVSPSATASPTVTATVTQSPAAGQSGSGQSNAAANPCAQGGPIAIYQVELLSRQIMRVVIPAGVAARGGFVDVHIATPYGVSSHLAIPVSCEPCPCQPAPMPTSGYTIPTGKNTLTIPYNFKKDGASLTPVIVDNVQGDLQVNWDNPTGMAWRSVRADVSFKVGDKPVPIPLQFDSSKGAYQVADDKAKNLRAFAENLIDQFAKLSQYTPDKPLPATLDSSQVDLVPLMPPMTPTPFPIDVKTEKPVGKITVQFQRVPKLPPAEN
jgi:hypothetical protein